MGVTGEGVFHGSSTGLEAFQAATPAAAAAAMTVKISHPRFLGFGSLPNFVETALVASSATALICLPVACACSWTLCTTPESTSFCATASTCAGAFSKTW
ncbi:hypothetical protein PJL18_04165 [Paenarthrobacter nicotinovorans]|nr:hypothetical protein [Paenarthrobacter nicotinovorans]